MPRLNSGRMPSALGIEEVNFTFEGHTIVRKRGLRVLNHEELKNGDVSLEYVSKLMNRSYTTSPTIRKVLQSIWYQINKGQEIYVIGEILADKTVKGGTGWGAEFAKLCNKPLYVFDQKSNAWFKWNEVGLGRVQKSSRHHPRPLHGNRNALPGRKRQKGHRRAVRAKLRVIEDLKTRKHKGRPHDRGRLLLASLMHNFLYHSCALAHSAHGRLAAFSLTSVPTSDV